MPFVGGGMMGTMNRVGGIRLPPAAPKTQHSKLTSVGLYWSPGQGIRPPSGNPPAHQWGLYLTANVHKGHDLKVSGVTLNKTTKTLTLKADARGSGAAGRGTSKQEEFVRGGFGVKAEKWTVIVKDSTGKVLAKKTMFLGGPPAP